MHAIKKFLKIIFIILIIALIGFCVYRYYKLKSEGKLDEVFAKKATNNVSYNDDANSSYSSSSSSSEDNENNENNSSDGKYVVEEKNYDGYYNQFNFDNRLLLYEGKQLSQAAKEAFDLLIQDADDSLYSKPTIVFRNFSGLTVNEITASDLVEYKSVLQTAQNTIGGASCTFEFEYNKLKTYVNKIIITKN